MSFAETLIPARPAPKADRRPLTKSAVVGTVAQAL